MANKILSQATKKKLGFTATRVFISAGAPIEQKELDFFQNLDIKINDIYGQTETGGPILINGKPIGQIEIKIGLWDDKKEIQVAGKCIMLGYYHSPSATQEVIKEITLPGETKKIYRTGDAGRVGKRVSQGLAQGFTQIFYDGRLGDGGKGGNGEYYHTAKLYELEKEIKKIAGVEEVIFNFEGKPYLVALIFHDPTLYSFTKTHSNIQQRLHQIGEGIYKIKNFRLLDKKELILTPTMKVRKKEVITKFQKVIDKMYENH